jgi:putative endonuclease
MHKPGYVYIMANRRNGTLYVGVTSNLVRRVWEHKHDLVEGFTKRYSLHLLVYFERFPDIRKAIMREKRLKKWNRAWKLRLIEEMNPTWRDLYKEYCASMNLHSALDHSDENLDSRLRGNDVKS